MNSPVNSRPGELLRPIVGNRSQRTLFPQNAAEALAWLKVSQDEFARWVEIGWIEDDYIEHGVIELDDVTRLRFVRDLVRSGLPDAWVKRLLKELPRPLPDRSYELAYHFNDGWIIAARYWERSRLYDFQVDEWLEDLAESHDLDRLTSFHERIGRLLDDLRNQEEE